MAAAAGQGNSEFLQKKEQGCACNVLHVYTTKNDILFKPQCHHDLQQIEDNTRHRFAKMYPGRSGRYADQGLVCKIGFDDNPPILGLALAAFDIEAFQCNVVVILFFEDWECLL